MRITVKQVCISNLNKVVRQLFIIITFFSFNLICCQSVKNNSNQKSTTSTEDLQKSNVMNLEKAYFASGCFWCVEAIYESVNGVHESVSGYSGGYTKNPTYESSNTGRTGHAETVEVYYDSKIVSFSTLLDVYFGSQNINQVNGQGPDKGSQYRSIVFYQNDKQKELILNKISELEKKQDIKVAAEVYPFEKFWKAEGYHQNYERLNPNNPYVRNVSISRLKLFKSKFPKLLK